MRKYLEQGQNIKNILLAWELIIINCNAISSVFISLHWAHFQMIKTQETPYKTPYAIRIEFINKYSVYVCISFFKCFKTRVDMRKPNNGPIVMQNSNH